MNSSITISPNGRTQTLEYKWVGAADASRPVLVFLHEGLGCITLWRSFPEKLCERLGARGLVYSRFAYGASTPRPHDEAFPVDYLSREAVEVLPVLLDALGIENPWLIGHSDGGTIALLAAARYRQRFPGIAVMAPHYFVEQASIDGIEKARIAYEQPDSKFRESLARHHKDVDSAFYAWCDIWLSPAFRSWNVGAELANIICPVLAIQGKNDEYAASLEQIEEIKRQAPQAELLALPNCGHSPHLDQPEAVVDAISDFILRHDAEAFSPSSDPARAARKSCAAP